MNKRIKQTIGKIALFGFSAFLFSASSCQNESDDSLGICSDCIATLDTNGNMVYVIDSITESYMAQYSQDRYFDLDKDGYNDFYIETESQSSYFNLYKIKGVCNNCSSYSEIKNRVQVIDDGGQNGYEDARPLFYGNAFDTVYHDRANIRYDLFNYPDTRYIGIQFEQSGNIHYGYFKVQRDHGWLKIFEIAWNPTPNQPVW